MARGDEVTEFGGVRREQEDETRVQDLRGGWGLDGDQCPLSGGGGEEKEIMIGAEKRFRFNL